MQPYISRFDDLNNGKRFNACRCITKLLTNPKNPKKRNPASSVETPRSYLEVKENSKVYFVQAKNITILNKKSRNQIYTTLVVHVHSLFKDQRKYGFFFAVYGYFF